MIGHQAGKAANECGTIEFLEFVEAAPVNDARDDLPHIVALAAIPWNDAQEFMRIVTWWFGCSNIPGNVLASIEIGDDTAADCQSVFVIQSIVVGDTGGAAVHIRPPQFFSPSYFPCPPFTHRRPTPENHP